MTFQLHSPDACENSTRWGDSKFLPHQLIRASVQRLTISMVMARTSLDPYLATDFQHPSKLRADWFGSNLQHNSVNRFVHC